MYNMSYSHKGAFVMRNNKMVILLYSVDYHNRNAPVREFNVFIDTGAFLTLLNKETADEFGYPIIEEKCCAISGFSEKGLLCDLRKIPALLFCGFTIRDVIIATPHHDDVHVSEVLGMNVLENFDIGLVQTCGELYLNLRAPFISEKPRYQSGEISLLTDEVWNAR